ncbi:MAG: enoyl-CoA hydratase-related protein [Ahrensia sp.]|nr:enoyl-CoA hydratase-related protein [Ahrensia sp.]
MVDLPQSDTLDLEQHDGWLTVWFNSPQENRNALTSERSDALLDLCGVLQSARDIRGVTFRGRGGVFCAGGDLKSFRKAASGESNRTDTLAMSRSAGGLYEAINTLPQITVMALEGPCVAGGMGIASCGDVVIAERETRFSLTEVRIGLAPAQIAPFLIARIGMASMRRLALTGAMFDAQEARHIGLVDTVVDGAEALNDAVADVILQTSDNAPNAVAATKSLLLSLPGMNREDQINAAAATFTDCMFSAEGREGLTAFAQKRKPNWALPKEGAG